MKVQEGKFKLQDLLVVPMQRVLKYHLLLKVSETSCVHIMYYTVQIQNEVIISYRLYECRRKCACALSTSIISSEKRSHTSEYTFYLFYNFFPHFQCSRMHFRVKSVVMDVMLIITINIMCKSSWGEGGGLGCGPHVKLSTSWLLSVNSLHSSFPTLFFPLSTPLLVRPPHSDHVIAPLWAK